MVQIQSKQERSFWAATALNAVPDLIISVVASYFLDLGIPGFFGILLAKQAVYFCIWIKSVTWVWLLFWLSGRRKMAAHLEDFLYKNKFPQPPEFVTDIDDYLSRAAEDAKLHCATRVKAATELGTLVGIKASGRLLYRWQLNIAYEDALQK
jgi:hypothetical protein